MIGSDHTAIMLSLSLSSVSCLSHRRQFARLGWTLHCTALLCAALRCTALHCAALHCAALCCTVLCCAALHCTALCCRPVHGVGTDVVHRTGRCRTRSMSRPSRESVGLLSYLAATTADRQGLLLASSAACATHARTLPHAHAHTHTHTHMHTLGTHANKRTQTRACAHSRLH